LGDSKTPLYALIISSILNVLLDLLFVVVFNWGVAGAGIATIIAQAVSAVFCIIHMVRRRHELNLAGLTLRTNKNIIKIIIKAGLPGAIESCLISLGTMSVQRLVNSFGASAMAAYTASTKIDSIAIAPVVSVANAISVYTGQNMGAGNIDRIKKGLYQSLGLLICACIVIASLIVIFRYQLLGIFLDSATAQEAIEIGGQYLTIVCVAYIVAAIMRSYLNVLRGAGDVNVSAVSGLTELSGRIIFAYLLVRPLGVIGIWVATPIAWAMGAAVPLIRYYSGKWMTKKLI
jgi:putative MATE family efflux protein